MAIDNPIPVNTKVMTKIFGLGTVVGFVQASVGWKYQVQFPSVVFEEGSKFWMDDENVRKATWLEVLLYG